MANALTPTEVTAIVGDLRPVTDGDIADAIWAFCDSTPNTGYGTRILDICGRVLSERLHVTPRRADAIIDTMVSEGIITRKDEHGFRHVAGGPTNDSTDFVLALDLQLMGSDSHNGLWWSSLNRSDARFIINREAAIPYAAETKPGEFTGEVMLRGLSDKGRRKLWELRLRCAAFGHEW